MTSPERRTAIKADLEQAERLIPHGSHNLTARLVDHIRALQAELRALERPVKGDS
jgi:hypothetical protein